jgi:SnoaL-like domain
MSHDYKSTWEVYVSAWKAMTIEDKRAKLKASAAANIVYRDPLAEANGHQALTEYMLSFREQVPGGYFVTTAFYCHHQRGAAKWNMMNGQGQVIGDGVSYVEFEPQGKIAQVSGFFETPK